MNLIGAEVVDGSGVMGSRGGKFIFCADGVGWWCPGDVYVCTSPGGFPGNVSIVSGICAMGRWVGSHERKRT